MKPEAGKEYYLDVEIRRETETIRIKAIGSYSHDLKTWELSEIFANKKVTADDMSKMFVTAFNDIPEDLPKRDHLRMETFRVEKDKDFENRLGLILDTVEGMITEFWGDSQGFAEAMVEAGYAPFEGMEPLPSFPRANNVFKSPKEWEGKVDCGNLAVYYDPRHEEVTSVWKSISPAHRLRFFLDGLICLTIHSRGMPPVKLTSGMFPDLKQKPTNET